MKHLLALVGLTACVALAAEPKVPECFKVHALLKMDDEHYWAEWTNSCPYTIDSVYVMVGFQDRSRAPLANGVWSLHFIAPGTHRVIRLTAPSKAPDFQYVSVKRITVDAMEALRREGDY